MYCFMKEQINHRNLVDLVKTCPLVFLHEQMLAICVG